MKLPKSQSKYIFLFYFIRSNKYRQQLLQHYFYTRFLKYVYVNIYTFIYIEFEFWLIWCKINILLLLFWWNFRVICSAQLRTAPKVFFFIFVALVWLGSVQLWFVLHGGSDLFFGIGFCFVLFWICIIFRFFVCLGFIFFVICFCV